MSLRSGTWGQIFQANLDIVNNARTVWPRTTKFGRIQHVRRGVFLWVHRRPYRKGAGPKRSQFGGSFLFMRTPYVAELAYQNLTLQHNVGEGRVAYLWTNYIYTSHPKRAEFHQRSPIRGVLLYLCLHPLTQNYQIGHGNTYGKIILFPGPTQYISYSYGSLRYSRFVPKVPLNTTKPNQPTGTYVILHDDQTRYKNFFN